MTTYLKNIGANHILRNRQFIFTPKIQYEMAAERSEATISGLPFSKVSPHEESNLDLLLRREPFYPLNYGEQKVGSQVKIFYLIYDGSSIIRLFL